MTKTKTIKPQVEKRIKYLNKLITEICERAAFYSFVSVQYENAQNEIKKLERLVKKNEKILYFEDDQFTFADIKPHINSWMFAGNRFEHDGVEYVLTYKGIDLICFKKSGKGNQKEITVYKRIVRSNSVLEKMYLTFVNDFLTLDRFASYYNLSHREANDVINKGRKINNAH